MAWTIPNQLPLTLMEGGINMKNDSFYIILCTGLVPVTVSNFGGITTELPTAGGTYTRKQLVKASGSPVLVDTNKAMLDFNDVEWSNLYVPGNYTVTHTTILKGSAASPNANDPILINYVLPQSVVIPSVSSNQNLVIVFDPLGALRIGSGTF